MRISDWSSDVCSSDLARPPDDGPVDARDVDQALFTRPHRLVRPVGEALAFAIREEFFIARAAFEFDGAAPARVLEQRAIQRAAEHLIGLEWRACDGIEAAKNG